MINNNKKYFKEGLLVFFFECKNIFREMLPRQKFIQKFFLNKKIANSRVKVQSQTVIQIVNSF